VAYQFLNYMCVHGYNMYSQILLIVYLHLCH
jgi:hypothetical protein